jgi:hypothetical protein
VPDEVAGSLGEVQGDAIAVRRVDGVADEANPPIVGGDAGPPFFFVTEQAIQAGKIQGLQRGETSPIRDRRSDGYLVHRGFNDVCDLSFVTCHPAPHRSRASTL